MNLDQNFPFNRVKKKGLVGLKKKKFETLLRLTKKMEWGLLDIWAKAVITSL
jgi:hypothetical protein